MLFEEFEKRLSKKLEEEFENLIPEDYFNKEKRWGKTSKIFKKIGIILMTLSIILFITKADFSLNLTSFKLFFDTGLRNLLFITGTILFSASYVLLSLQANPYSSLKLSMISTKLNRFENKIKEMHEKWLKNIKKK